MTRHILAASGLIAMLLVISLAYSLPAMAKATPVRVEPPADAVLTEAPGQVDMWFDQPLERGTDAVSIALRRDGYTNEIRPLYRAVDPADPTHLIFSPPPNLTAGRYVVSWKATSAKDGQVSEGEFSFAIDPNAAPIPGAAAESGGPDLLKTMLLALGGVGGGTFVGFLAYLFRRAIGFAWHRPTEGGGEQH